MEPKRSWWQQIKIHPYAIGIVVVLALILFILSAYKFGWDWTGFNSGTNQITIISTSKGNYTATVLQPSKSLWDWLGLLALLAVPVVVGFGAAWFTAQQAQASEKNRERQDRESEANRERRHDTDIEIAKENRKIQRETDLQIAADNQQEAALQGYIDKMSVLILNEHLGELTPERKPKPEYSEIRTIAQVRTLYTLNRLTDPQQKATIVQFLYGTGLIAYLPTSRFMENGGTIIDLTGANLTGANLDFAILAGADLSFTNLSGARLQSARLDAAHFSKANLTKAHLSGAYLYSTYLDRASLVDADLSGAILEDVNLWGAELSRANLLGTRVTEEQLKQAASLKGATMPDGSIHE